MNVHKKKKKMEWATPWELFHVWDISHGPFTLDVCATWENAKCRTFFSPATNGLIQCWHGVCWMNPPYAERIVCLLPARTDTAWWHAFVMPYGDIHFLRGRVRFEGAKHPAPFPSAVVIFR